MSTNRAFTISPKDIAKAVDSAVKLASEKHKVQFAPEFHIGPGTIMGRILQTADVGIKQAEQIASEITSHAGQQHGISAEALARPVFEPAVLIRKNLILCGFYPGPIPEIQQQF
jgi:hypothetical protein